MVLQIFSVFDSKVGAYLPPIFMRSRGEALRMFEAAVRDGNHDFAKFSSDYTLFHLGSFDDSTGLVETFNGAHVSLGKAIEFVKDNITPLAAKPLSV